METMFNRFPSDQISSWEWGSARLGYILVWSMLNRKYRRRSQSLPLPDWPRKIEETLLAGYQEITPEFGSPCDSIAGNYVLITLLRITLEIRMRVGPVLGRQRCLRRWRNVAEPIILCHVIPFVSCRILNKSAIVVRCLRTVKKLRHQVMVSFTL